MEAISLGSRRVPQPEPVSPDSRLRQVAFAQFTEFFNEAAPSDFEGALWGLFSNCPSYGGFKAYATFMEHKLPPYHRAEADLSKLVQEARIGNLEAIQRAGIDLDRPSASGAFLITAAAEAGQLQVVTYLMDQGCDLHVHTHDKRTAYDLALWNGHQEVAEKILQGMSVSIVGSRGVALRAAVQGGELERIDWLLSASAPIEQRDITGENALHIAARLDDPTILGELLSAAKPEAIYARSARGGQTPLHIAVATENWRGVVALLLHGADLMMTDDAGRTPLDVARFDQEAKEIVPATPDPLNDSIVFTPDGRASSPINARRMARVSLVIVPKTPPRPVKRAAPDVTDPFASPNDTRPLSRQKTEEADITVCETQASNRSFSDGGASEELSPAQRVDLSTSSSPSDSPQWERRSASPSY